MSMLKAFYFTAAYTIKEWTYEAGNQIVQIGTI